MLGWLREKLSNNQTNLALGLCGLCAATGFAYIIFKSYGYQFTKTASSRHTSDHSQPQTKSLVQVVNSVRKEVSGTSEISFEAMRAIYKGQFILSQPAYQKIVKKSRDERRICLMDLPRYLELIHILEDDLQKLHDRNLDAILAHFKLSKNQWRELVLRFEQEQPEEWLQMILGADMDQQASLHTPHSPSLSSSKIFEIYEYKLHILPVVIMTARQCIPVSEPTMVYPFIERRVSDLVYLQFYLQDENVFAALGKLSPEESERANQLEEKLNERLRKELGLTGVE